jgi:hypothetical protein
MSNQKLEHLHIIQPEMCLCVVGGKFGLPFKKRKETEGIWGRYWGAAERRYRRLE